MLLSMVGELLERQPVSALITTAEPQVLWESEPCIFFPVLPQWEGVRVSLGETWQPLQEQELGPAPT